MYKMILLLCLSLVLPVTGIANEDIKVFFEQADVFFKKHVKNGLVDYEGIKNNTAELDELMKMVETTSLAGLAREEQIAFYINAYNLTVINSLLPNYPIASIQSINGFFDNQVHLIAREKMTLNDLEKEKLLKHYPDARYHFVLVCAAKGCPKITNFAYRPAQLDAQLEAQTRLALNDPNFIQVDEVKKTVKLSQIFSWYKNDFLEEGDLLDFVNKYRESFISKNYRLGYYEYDWALNDTKENRNSGNLSNNPTPTTTSNLKTYTPSALLKPKQIEVKVFNNLYTQAEFFDSDKNRKSVNGRDLYFTSIAQFSYGLSSKFNLGFDAYFKTASFRPTNGVWDNRVGLPVLGPKLKYAPFNIKGLSFQTIVLFPLRKGLEGNANTSRFLEYQGIQWFQQTFYDKRIGEDFNIFGEFTLWSRIDTQNDGVKSSNLSTPLKIFPSYFATDWLSFYLMTEWTPTWGDGGISAYYIQSGAGAKFQVTKRFELEVLYSSFWNGKNAGAGQTYNLGVRYLY